MHGIADGRARAGVKVDSGTWSRFNASIEFGYYTPSSTRAARSSAPDQCSAFVATGSYTRDGRVVIAHNNWSSYLEGSRWNIDLRHPARRGPPHPDGRHARPHPQRRRLRASTPPASSITETTISGFDGFDPTGVPEFARARKAMQYAASIDDFARIMTEGNNGGYANDWLVADRNTNEIASLELGLKNVTLERTKDGYFVGANFPVEPEAGRGGDEVQARRSLAERQRTPRARGSRS